MARLTASDMISMVRDNCGGETSETLSDTRILRFINQAYLQLAAKNKFPQLSVATPTTITTADGTTTYELSIATVSKINDIEDTTNKFHLRQMSEWQYRRYTQGQASSQKGVPTHWYMDGVGSNNRFQVTFWPTPAGAYSLNVYYQQKPTELVTSPAATSAVIPEEWDEPIIYRATARGWRQLGDLAAVREWDQAARLIENDARGIAHYGSEIPVRPGSKIGGALQDV
jgi:hypothetical protein